MAAPRPTDDAQRLAVLRDYQILDTLPEPCFDRIVSLAAEACETPIALFSLVDEHRQWFKANVGLAASGSPRDDAFCAHAVAANEALVVEDAEVDDRFADNPLVLKQPRIRFYAGVPVRAAVGQPLGTLCVIDDRPRSLSTTNRLVLEGLAREIEAQLEIRRIAIEQQYLLEERAVLSNLILHDARGLLTALGWSLDRLRQRLGDENGPLSHAFEATTELKRLCDAFAQVDERGSRGLTVKTAPADLRAWFESMAARARGAAARCDIRVEARCDLSAEPCVTDILLLDRIARNLYENAIDACTRDHTIRIRAGKTDDGGLELCVEDNGPGVAPEDAPRIFSPYFTKHTSGSPGTGLGLAFCRLACEAMDGDIEYRPRKPSGATFTVRLPLIVDGSAADEQAAPPPLAHDVGPSH